MRYDKRINKTGMRYDVRLTFLLVLFIRSDVEESDEESEEEESDDEDEKK